MNLVKFEKIRFGKGTELSERIVQDTIKDDPSVLGLGVVTRSIAYERRHYRAGRLDLLLESEDQETRFVVEIQLGELDESHIVRTIEYWDIERRNNPAYDHVAVIVAEGVGRFLNVIGLLAGRIPIMVIQMNAYAFDGNTGLVFSKVIDQTVTPDDLQAVQDAEPASRNLWVAKSSEDMVKMVEKIGKMLSNSMELRYVNSYIALGKNNEFIFKPKRSFALIELRTEQNEELDSLFAKLPINLSYEYDSRRRRYKIRVAPNEADNIQKYIEDIGKHVFISEANEE